MIIAAIKTVAIIKLKKKNDKFVSNWKMTDEFKMIVDEVNTVFFKIFEDVPFTSMEALSAAEE